MGNHLNEKLREVTTRLNMLVELNAEEKYRALHEDSNLSKVLKSTQLIPEVYPFWVPNTKRREKKETNKQKKNDRKQSNLDNKGSKTKKFKTKGSFQQSELAGRPAGLRPDQSLRKRNRLF